mmetsp:Transcript_113841/g.220991  ORF Transcript_113841/g.220991 Transcript_113841/m.220991 type:complete len:208 (-) Transcript_113841:285-908(-)
MPLTLAAVVVSTTSPTETLISENLRSPGGASMLTSPASVATLQIATTGASQSLLLQTPESSATLLGSSIFGTFGVFLLAHATSSACPTSSAAFPACTTLPAVALAVSPVCMASSACRVTWQHSKDGADSMACASSACKMTSQPGTICAWDIQQPTEARCVRSRSSVDRRPIGLGDGTDLRLGSACTSTSSSWLNTWSAEGKNEVPSC